MQKERGRGDSLRETALCQGRTAREDAAKESTKKGYFPVRVQTAMPFALSLKFFFVFSGKLCKMHIRVYDMHHALPYDRTGLGGGRGRVVSADPSGGWSHYGPFALCLRTKDGKAGVRDNVTYFLFRCGIPAAKYFPPALKCEKGKVYAQGNARKYDS